MAGAAWLEIGLDTQSGDDAFATQVMLGRCATVVLTGYFREICYWAVGSLIGGWDTSSVTIMAFMLFLWTVFAGLSVRGSLVGMSLKMKVTALHLLVRLGLVLGTTASLLW